MRERSGFGKRSHSIRATMYDTRSQLLFGEPVLCLLPVRPWLPQMP